MVQTHLFMDNIEFTPEIKSYFSFYKEFLSAGKITQIKEFLSVGKITQIY